MGLDTSRTIGINGLGRIGKLSLWRHLATDDFDRIVVNVGRQVGKDLDALRQYIEKDSTYGALHRYIGGVNAEPDLKVVDEAKGLMSAYGKEIVVLREQRNPKDIPWADEGVQVVVDCTGKFVNPTDEADKPGGSLRGHLEAGARVVLQSSAFKLPKGESSFPEDTLMMIEGINDYKFDPTQHKLISAASCTTTGLAHMMRPILDNDLGERLVTAGMSTVHAATNSQSVLDSVPGANAKDLRKTRASLNNVIITSTNAAAALEHVMPEIGQIGFMADSVRIPTLTSSLIILNLTFNSEENADGTISVDRDAINAIYKKASEGPAKGLVKFSVEQNVSSDMIGENAAITIESTETHSRTGFMNLRHNGENLRVPLTHVKICGWYDNELGSYTNRLANITRKVAKEI